MTRHQQFPPAALAALIALLLAAVPAAAAGSGFYAGGAFGASDFRDACDGDDGFEPGVACDDSDQGWKLFGGYELTPHWAFEVAYADLGAARADVTIGELFVVGEVGVDGYSAAALGTLPLGDRFALFAKAGVVHWIADARLRSNFDSYSDAASGEAFLFGGGARVSLGERVAVRAEWERYGDIGDQELTGRSDVDLLSLGVLFRF